MKPRTILNFVDGAFQPATDGATELILNPADGSVIAHAPVSGTLDVDDGEMEAWA